MLINLYIFEILRLFFDRKRLQNGYQTPYPKEKQSFQDCLRKQFVKKIPCAPFMEVIF